MAVLEYRIVKDFPAYRVGNDGSIWSRFKPGPNRDGTLFGNWKQLSCNRETRMGYLDVELRNGKKRRRVFLHVLILETFKGPCPPGMICRHFPDADVTNNAVTNLRYGTHKQNADDRDRDGHTARGSRHHKAKLTEEDVLKIRATPGGYGVIRDLAKKYGVDRTTIHGIRSRKIWTHI